MFSFRTSFNQLLFFEGIQLNFSSPKENCQMKAGQYKIHSINPVKILQSPQLQEPQLQCLICGSSYPQLLMKLDLISKEMLNFVPCAKHAIAFFIAVIALPKESLCTLIPENLEIWLKKDFDLKALKQEEKN